MVLNQKPTGRALSMPGGLLVGAVWSLGITLVLAAVIAKLVDSEVMPESSIGYCVMGLLTAASLIGSLAAFRKIKRQRVLVCLISGGIYYGILLAMTALFFGGQFTGMGVTALMILIGSGAAALAGLREGRGGSKKRLKVGAR